MRRWHPPYMRIQRNEVKCIRHANARLCASYDCITSYIVDSSTLHYLDQRRYEACMSARAMSMTARVCEVVMARMQYGNVCHSKCQHEAERNIKMSERLKHTERCAVGRGVANVTFNCHCVDIDSSACVCGTGRSVGEQSV
jgi:hypothetical protein